MGRRRKSRGSKKPVLILVLVIVILTAVGVGVGYEKCCGSSIPEPVAAKTGQLGEDVAAQAILVIDLQKQLAAVQAEPPSGMCNVLCDSVAGVEASLDEARGELKRRLQGESSPEEKQAE
jgi:hypothetical protein